MKSKKRSVKPVFFIVTILILAFTYLAIFGVSMEYGDKRTVIVKGGEDIRFGIDIRGGVEATFTPAESAGDISADDLNTAKSVIERRLIDSNITDYEVYTDTTTQRIIVRFPWKEDESSFDPEAALEELGATSSLTFRQGDDVDENGLPTGEVVLTGSDVNSATVMVDTSSGSAAYVVSLELEESGKEKFADITTELAGTEEVISIWMDDTLISSPTVDEPITGGSATITSTNGFTAEEAQELADRINSGALPFDLTTENFSTVSPSLGSDSLQAMIIAGVIGFLLVAIFMIVFYRLPGWIAVISLLGQLAGMIAAISGFFPVFSSFTLTLPGIAALILSLGMGVDANIVAAERIKEEIRVGKSIDGALKSGYSRAFTAIFDSNITMVIVALILMAAFGSPDTFLAKFFTPVFFMFSGVSAGTIYSFGYTLLVGVICNFVFGVFASRIMLKSISKFKRFRNPRMYGGDKIA